MQDPNPDKLKDARKGADLNQDEAADLCRVSLSTWNKWERGINPIPYPAFIGCLVLLGYTRDEALAEGK